MLNLLAGYIPIDRRLAIAQNRPIADRVEGTALFADISGFTPLTDALVKKLGRRQAVEELTRHLNEVYTALIAQVHAYQGSVIGFVGDAITCWFDGDDALRAVTCAQAIQQAMAPFANITLPEGGSFSLYMKIGLASGPARRFRVGDPAIQYIDVMTGTTLIQMALAEKQAQEGEIILHSSTINLLGQKISRGRWRTVVGGSEIFAPLETLHSPAPVSPWPPLPPNSFSPNQLKAWLLKPVYERLLSGQEQFLAELRSATALFLKFDGLDFDSDANVGLKLNAYICWVQQTVTRFGGYLIQLTIGDRGSFMYIAFGAPITHANDNNRAVHTALALQQPPPELAFIKAQIGVAQGKMRTGAYGSERRRAYGVIGDDAILAHRLMMIARPGQILCAPKVYQDTWEAFDYKNLPPVTIKGKFEPVEVFSPFRVAQPELESFHPNRSDRQINTPFLPSGVFEQKLIGRKAELAQFQQSINQIKEGESVILLVEGEAGIGKSRLITELSRLLFQARLPVIRGAGYNTEQFSPYRVWRDILIDLFGLHTLRQPEKRKQHVYNLIQDLKLELVEYLPLLNDLLNLNFSETDFTASLSAPQRQQRLIELLELVLERWARQTPLAIIIEDAHWCDTLSWELIDRISQMAHRTAIPLMMVISTRGLTDPERLIHYHRLLGFGLIKRLRLKNLSPTDTLSLISNRLGLSANNLPPELANLVVNRAGGNPFYAEELIYTLRDKGLIKLVLSTTPQNGEADLLNFECVINGDLLAGSQSLPDTLHGLILSRIDQLPPEQQLTLKVAAVIGRTFSYAPLQYVLNRHNPVDDLTLKTRLEALNVLDLTLLESPEPELSYVFKHIITQEVAYETLLFSQRRQLHQRVAEWYEETYPQNLASFYPLLAHHWAIAVQGQAIEPALVNKAIDYLQKAGDQARTLYAHQEAIQYYQQALDLQTSQNHYEPAARTLMKIGLTHHNAFNFRAAREAYNEGFSLWQQAAGQLRQSLPPSPHPLRLTWPVDPPTIDPAFTSDVNSAHLIEQLFSGLISQTPEGDIIPDAAQHWEIKDEGRKYLFYLQPDLRWSDGQPLTAYDFVFAWQRLFNPHTASPIAGVLNDIKGAKAVRQGKAGLETLGVSAPAPNQLVIELEQATGHFLHLLTQTAAMPVPRHIVQGHKQNWTNPAHIVTNGPFKLTHFEAGSGLTLARNPYYHGQFKGNIERVIISFVGDGTAGDKNNMLLYENDQIDILDLRAPQASIIGKHANSYILHPLLQANYLSLNVAASPLNDVRVRQALAMAIDKEKYVAQVLNNFSMPATGGFIPPAMPGHVSKVGLSFNPVQARLLLAQAGYRSPADMPVIRARASVGQQEDARFLQNEWQENLGINVSWEIEPWSVFLSKMTESPADIFIVGWTADIPDPDAFLRIALEQSHTNWIQADYNNLVEQARKIADQPRRLTLYRQADRLLMAQAAIIPLSYGRAHLLVKPWVRQLPIFPSRGLAWKDIVIDDH